MNRKNREKLFASKLRNFIVEFISVFSIVALNGPFLVLISVTVINKGFEKTTIALAGALYLFVSCVISTALIYFVKGRVYHNKIKVFYDIANEVAKGDFSVRVPTYFVKPKSEMDFLAVNFNKMLVEISSLENMRNDFVADVSHEIKTPLSVVQGYADLLQNKDLSDDFYFQCFENDKRFNAIMGPTMKIRKKNTYIEEVNFLLKNKCKSGDGIFR